MIVDDQVSLTKIVTMIAEQMGLCVHVVNDSTAALDAYLEHRPDILMLDMIMPEKDGVDVLNEIMLTGIDSQVILTSGFTESYARLAASVAQFHNKQPVFLLKKPFRRDKLIAVLREALDRG
jgi:CheY-like chemotaxis protein